MIKFITAEKKFQQISHLQLKQMYLKISGVESPTWREFMELKDIAEVKLSEYSRFLDFDIRDIELTSVKCKEFTIKDGDVFNGIFLPENKFLVIDYKNNGRFLIYDRNWECIRVIKTMGLPYDAIQFKDEIFVTKVSSKTIQVFARADFRYLRSINIKDIIY